MPARGIVFDVQHGSFVDGPGIRTTVFMMGCPLRCAWCHNPESQASSPFIMRYPTSCIGCGACTAACPAGAIRMRDGLPYTDTEKCLRCGACTDVCPKRARSLCGKAYGVQELTRELLADTPFYENSGGGVTFSGGEPLVQAHFVSEAAAVLHDARVDVAVDTSGEADWSAFEEVLPFTSLFLFDVKCADDSKHRRHTGAGNRKILENLSRLDRADVRIRIRVPVIHGFNDTVEEMEEIARIVASLEHVESVELLPFHKLGLAKYGAMDRQCEASQQAIPKSFLQYTAEVFRTRGVFCATLA